MEGFLPIWKPADITSYDVIRRVKRLLPKGHKIGHAGTLDPFAEGVLILMLGRSATKRFDEIQTWPKTYRATATLGSTSDTLDRTGKIVECESDIVTSNQIENAVKKFVGEVEQTIPQYSAAKYKGRALYTYARRGIEIPAKSKKVTVYSITVEGVTRSNVELLVTCSSGTYIRQLSYDIFHSIGVASYLNRLIRVSVGAINRDSCLTIDQLTDEDMLMKHLLPSRDE